MTTFEQIEFEKDLKPMRKVYIIISIIVIAILLFRGCEMERQGGISVALNQSLKDSLTTYKTKDGLNAAKISVFEADKEKDFISLATKDTTIQKLQKLVESNKSKIHRQGSISIINTETNVGTTVATKVIDSILPLDSIKSPVYTSNFNLKGWIKGSTIATKDSTSIKLTYKEELNLIIGKEKTGFLGLGKGKTFADVVLLNPYSEVKQMRVYSTKEPATKRITIGPGVYYGIGNSFQPQVFIGIGVTWKLIAF
ncbi:hypothetical protein BOX09_gp37 [Flavobacterium phage Fpv1]|uniref:Uncharacterized protein n=4 Tax=Fipvunavirus TaxID=2560132 RepID=A0A1B0WKH2_9CAUD|nr:hypothetical protein BOW80_gp36 [Flavobacterium phage Fpv3]YP_009321906.1 hypothetical protein BOW81_gp37 [Flavobacterium phage Fpv20]YP_009322039.1 hypothetical protein BOX09_gp37 [Flavobacterium phage Fpv1]YP_009323628.1 hypothetical protein BOW82_gp37 [Flavobacterium phage Fpv2]YP_009594091.1 hypothetical protein FDG89_gp35 [Flavobacterium phage FpV4]ALN97282.1 hypothetical protein [Flavobacterium phage FpV21]QCW20306.1 hypothetical protein [Flavobacterium phage FPSV-F12]QCW20695.1 hyp